MLVFFKANWCFSSLLYLSGQESDSLRFSLQTRSFEKSCTFPDLYSYWSILFLASIIIKVGGTCLSFSHRRLFLVFGNVFSLVLTVSVSHDLYFGFCSCGGPFSTKSLSVAGLAL